MEIKITFASLRSGMAEVIVELEEEAEPAPINRVQVAVPAPGVPAEESF